jgi:hypothetical protein
MVRECLEAIDRRFGQAKNSFTVHVAGQVGDMVTLLPEKQAAVFRRPWVQLRGFVPEIRSFYEELDIVLSPVIAGTGINVKSVEAMAYGLPLLSTLCGCKGIETGDPMHNHMSVDALTASLFDIAKRPSELERLADLSRGRYLRFYGDNYNTLNRLLAHPKLCRQLDGTSYR